MIFVLILICAHLFWFPEWINGYKWRFERQNFVGHNSLFVPFSKIGLYNKWLPRILTILSFALLLLFTLKKRVTLKESLLLPIVFSIIFNREAGYDRLLVANLALILLTPAVRIILVSYAIGCVFLITSSNHTLSWGIWWIWSFALLLEAISKHNFSKKNNRPLDF